CALRPDDLVADYAGDDLVVAEAPDRHALVPFDQRLGKLIQLLELAPAHVEVDERQILRASQLVERVAEGGRDATDVAADGRAAAPVRCRRRGGARSPPRPRSTRA